MAGSSPLRAASTCLARTPLRSSVPSGKTRPSSLSSSLTRRITSVDAAPTDSLPIRAGAKPSGDVPSTEQKRSHSSSRGAPGGGTVTTTTRAAPTSSPHVRAKRTMFCWRQKVRPDSGRLGGLVAVPRAPGLDAGEVVGEGPGPAVLHGLLPHGGDRAVEVAGGDHDGDLVVGEGREHAAYDDGTHRPEVLHRDHRRALVGLHLAGHLGPLGLAPAEDVARGHHLGEPVHAGDEDPAVEQHPLVGEQPRLDVAGAGLHRPHVEHEPAGHGRHPSRRPARRCPTRRPASRRGTGRVPSPAPRGRTPAPTPAPARR